MTRFDPEERSRRERREQRMQKLLEAEFREDFLAVMNSPQGRRILSAFMQDMGHDRSAFATNAMAQSHAIGMQDAVRWWLDLIRRYCPEKEGRMREEAKAQLRAIEAENPEDEEETE